jgi:hypothetical protein
MLKKNNSERKTIASHSHRIFEGNNLNNKLDNIYYQTLEKMRYSSQIDVNCLLPKEMHRLTKKKNKLQKQPNFYTINSQRNRKLSEYISLDSMFKKSPKSQSNDPPTQDASGKIVSPKKTNVKSNIFNSAFKYKLKPDLKIVTETKNLITKTDYKTKTKNNNEEGNIINNISLLSNESENNEPLSNRYQNINQIQKDTLEHENYNNNNLFESDNIINKKLTNKSKNNKVLNSSYSEPSFSSFKNENSKIPRYQKDYYSSMLNKNLYKNREKLIQSSINFYLHEQKLLPVSKKKEYLYDFNKKRPKIFSEMKRIPGVISFGKIIPKETITVQNQNKRRHIIYRPKQILGLNDDTKNIFRKGLTKGNSFKKLKQTKLIKDDYNTDDPNGQYYIPKDQFGNTVYPIFGQKKMLKNLMPKEYDYNTLKSPLELLHDTYHPLLRFQKKMLAQHINAINQEIGVTYSKHFTLVDKSKIPEKYQMCQDLIDLQKDEKLIKLIRDLIDRNFGLEKEVRNTLISQKQEKEMLKKKHIYKRISEVMLKASIHFKRLNLSLEDFYSIPSYMFSQSKKIKSATGEKIKDNEDTDEEEKQQQVIMQRNGQYFFQSIKAGDKTEILKLMNKNFFIMFYRDNFLQSPLHILAKRNLYKFISLFISRGADINAKDEGGRTPLFIAAKQNHLEFVTVLLFEIADPSIKNIKDERPIDVTTNTNIKLILERTKILHIFHKIGKIQKFNESIKNGLTFLYKEEMGINYQNWLKENDEIIKESQKI